MRFQKLFLNHYPLTLQSNLQPKHNAVILEGSIHAAQQNFTLSSLRRTKQSNTWFILVKTKIALSSCLLRAMTHVDFWLLIFRVAPKMQSLKSRVCSVEH